MVNNTITVDQGQNLMDICMQHLGDASGLIVLAELNGLEVTNDIYPGQVLELPPVIAAGAVAYYQDKAITVATDELEDTSTGGRKKEGINYWVIGEDFIVS